MATKSTKYFASRNGFDGFTSYFHHVFTPSEYTKIFILKGGPGTGKSTLMKRLHSTFIEECDRVDAILCSSDTSSYDGLILEKGERRIAFLDGTAPHITDPSLPVVCEEIVNLEDAIRSKEILKHRQSLESLLAEKRNEYQLAYHFLLVCGEINRNYSAVNIAVEEDVERDNLFYVLESLPYLKIGRMEKRLYTAFGKDGFYEQAEEGTRSDTTLSFNKGSSSSRLIQSKIEKHKISSTFILNCFNGEVDKIQIPSLSLTLSFSEKREIDPSLLSIYTEAMEISRSHLENASRHHFAMEALYRDALDFDVLDEIFLKLKEKTKVLLSIS